MKNFLYAAAAFSLLLCGCCAECRYYKSEPACQKAQLVCDRAAAEKAGKEKTAQVSDVQRALDTQCAAAREGCRQVLIQKGLIKKPQP
jgi:hypothetical protein